ncbi:type VII secretion target [Glycomyces luteolus]|uniref:Type VII secretion target n=1 Tax=Glycomyces luteolus TaxID=2670330 RepID=A0A9X3SSX9_9ACTN|nr:type VII secretion target [Glycomyces luteolus]MDA1361679.1 type VII secretion target [Glycomyces luteolus]
MGFRVQVESGQLRSGAGKMRSFASDASRIPDAVERDARSADSANRGFMTGEACEALAEDLKADMKELNEHLKDTAKGLEDAAQDWDDADEQMASGFDEIATRLRGA